MTIKEVEKQVKMKKANIRYYEEMGLITPDRNSYNNYRNYSAQDVETLKKIQYLRILGVSINDIAQLLKGAASLCDVITIREQEIQADMQKQRELFSLCHEITTKNYNIESLEVPSLETRSAFLQMKGINIMKQDKIKKLECYDKGLSLIVPILGSSTVLIFALIEFLSQKELSFTTEISVLLFLFIFLLADGIIRLKVLKLKRIN